MRKRGPKVYNIELYIDDEDSKKKASLDYKSTMDTVPLLFHVPVRLVDEMLSILGSLKLKGRLPENMKKEDLFIALAINNINGFFTDE